MTNEPKIKCWCASAGGCAGKSVEHLISHALFPEGKLQVQGFPWCKDEPKLVGINSVVSHILCERHNNLLSDCDKEAVKTAALFQSSMTAPLPGATVDRNVDGHLLERWLLKTAINVSLGCGLHLGVGMTGSQPGRPSEYLVQVALGKLDFTAQMGAYLLHPSAPALHSPTEICIMPLVKGDVIGGFYFELRSQPIYLNLFPGAAPSSIGAVSSLPLAQVLLDAPLVYRPALVTTTVASQPASLVRFQWRAGIKAPKAPASL